MPATHKRAFGIYLWDIFDNETILLHECDEAAKAVEWVITHYGAKLSPTGADKIDVVNQQGDIVNQFSIC